VKTMLPKRITIIPGLHGKLTADGKLSEPDIYWIFDLDGGKGPQTEG
jgi:hypothetical protein